MNEEETQLVQALQQGDRAACSDLVERYAGRIYGVALRLTRHPNEAEEVLQETLIAACRAVEDFQGRSSLGTWLYRIATNNGLMRLRRRRESLVSLDELGEETVESVAPQELSPWAWDPEDDVLTDELRQHLEDAIGTLPDTLRAAFVLRDIEGLSTDEAAEVLGISSSALKVRLHRARLMLREKLAQYLSVTEVSL